MSFEETVNAWENGCEPYRQVQITGGKLWQVYLDGDEHNEHALLFEGSKTGARAYIAQNFGMKEYRRGNVRMAQLIWEVPCRKEEDSEKAKAWDTPL